MSAPPLNVLSRLDRRKNEPGRQWYNTPKWKELRLFVFDRDLYTCQYVDKKTNKRCGRLEGNTSKLVAHHKKQQEASHF